MAQSYSVGPDARRKSGQRVAAIPGGAVRKLLVVLLAISGACANALIYRSVEPLFVILAFWVLGLILMHAVGAADRSQRRMYNVMFAVGSFVSAVAAFYAEYRLDPLQLISDAGVFFDLSTGASTTLSVEEWQALSDGAGAIVVWGAIYRIFEFLGFEKGRYIGVALNTVLVAWSCVAGLAVQRSVYGPSDASEARLRTLCSLCGVFWLFEAIHIRDAFVLFAVTMLLLSWTRYLGDRSFWRLTGLLIVSVMFVAAITFLRNEFVYVPLAMAAAAAGALFLAGERRSDSGWAWYALAGAAILIVGALLLQFQEAIVSLQERAYMGYSGKAFERATPGSLGATVIVGAPLPVRAVLGSAYLFVFPIPFWVGFQWTDAYHLFKSLNVLFFYFFTPLLLVEVWSLLGNLRERTPVVVFLAIFSVVMTIGIAATSLETRHFAVFLMPMLVAAASVDLARGLYRRRYAVALTVFLALIAVTHLAWAVAKA